MRYDGGLMPDFKLVAPFEPTGDQPAAIARLSEGIAKGERRTPAGALVGLTANSFNSLSLDPPLVLWSLAQKCKLGQGERAALALAEFDDLAIQLHEIAFIFFSSA